MTLPTQTKEGEEFWVSLRHSIHEYFTLFQDFHCWLQSSYICLLCFLEIFPLTNMTTHRGENRLIQHIGWDDRLTTSHRVWICRLTFSHRLQLETQINSTVFEQCYIYIELKEHSSWGKLDLYNVDPEQTQQTHCLCVSACFCSNVSEREDPRYKPLQIHFGKSFKSRLETRLLSLSILSDILMQAFPWRQRSF